MFHVSGAGCTAVLCGAAGGYPSGAQCVAVIYIAKGSSRGRKRNIYCCSATTPGRRFCSARWARCSGSGRRAVCCCGRIHLLSALAVGLSKPSEGRAERGTAARPTGERLRRAGGGRAERRAGNPADHNVRRGVFRAGTAFDAGIGAHSAGRGLHGADRDAGAVGRDRCAGGYADCAAMEAGTCFAVPGLRRALRLDADEGCAGPGGIIRPRDADGEAGTGRCWLR